MITQTRKTVDLDLQWYHTVCIAHLGVWNLGDPSKLKWALHFSTSAGEVQEIGGVGGGEVEESPVVHSHERKTQQRSEGNTTQQHVRKVIRPKFRHLHLHLHLHFHAFVLQIPFSLVASLGASPPERIPSHPSIHPSPS